MLPQSNPDEKSSSEKFDVCKSSSSWQCIAATMIQKTKNIQLSSQYKML